MLKELLSQALANPSVDTVGLNLESVEAHIQELNSYEKMVNEYIESTTSPSFCYARLKRVSIEPRRLYGKHVESRCCLEMSIVRAKELADGSWVPNSSDVVFTALLSEADVTNALLMSQGEEITPITITELAGFYPPAIEKANVNKPKYGTSFDNRKVELYESSMVIQEESKKLLQPTTRINKASKQGLRDALKSVRRFLESDDRYHLEIDSEHLDKEMLLVKNEAYEAMKELSIGGSELQSPKIASSSKNFSVFKAQYDVMLNVEERRDSSLLLSRYADVLTSSHDREMRKECLRQASFLINKERLGELGTAHYSKGALKMRRVSGGGELFGEPRIQGELFALNVSFSIESLSSFGVSKVRADSLIGRFGFSAGQLVELLQSVYSQKFIACTFTRMASKGIPQKPSPSVEKLAVLSEARSASLNHELLGFVDGLLELLDGSSTSKAYRQSLSEQATCIVAKIEAEVEKRTQKYERDLAALADAYKKDTMDEIMRTMDDKFDGEARLKEDMYALLGFDK